MTYSRFRQAIPLNVALLLFIGTEVSALDIEPNAGVGLVHTDNAALDATNEQEDWIAEISVGATLAENTSSLAFNAETLFSHQKYLEDTFGSQNYFRLRANADWEQIRERLNWNMQNYYTQIPIRSLDPDTADNTQDANVFSFGPNIHLQLSPRNSVTIDPLFQDYYYENSTADNQHYGVAAGWQYKMRPTMTTGLNASFDQVAYDNTVANPDYTISNVHGFISRKGTRSEYLVGVGSTHIDHDQQGNRDGLFANLDWLLRLSGRSSLRTCAVTDLTDSSADLFNSAVNPDCGNSSNVQVSGDVLRNNTVRLTYLLEGDTLHTRVWTEQRDLDYKAIPNDRKVQEYGANIEYQVSRQLTTGIGGGYIKTRETDIGRTDDAYAINGSAAYRLSPDLQWKFGVRYRDRDSTTSGEEYDEFSVFTGLVYGPGGFRSFN